MNREPLVSTVIPTYKRADMLGRAIDSVLNQTYRNVEVVVVDDNNPETEFRWNTELIMEKYINNPHVKYIKHEKNKNGSVARNTGIKHASGEYICFLDDDNYFYPTKIEKQLNYLLQNPEFHAVYCGWDFEDETVIPYKTGKLDYEQLLGSYIIDTNLIMMKKSIIAEFGGWDERLRRNQDVSFMLRYFSLGYKIGVVKESLVYRDLSDRSNVANPRENEKNFDDFLQFYKDYIAELENKIKNASKNIYSSRYRGVLFNYLKNRDFIGATRLYFKMLRVAPIMFNKYLIVALFKKINKQPLYSFSEDQ